MSRLCQLECRLVLVLAAAIPLQTGCVAPYSVTPEIETFEPVEFSDDALVTIGPRELLEDLSRSITKNKAGIAVVDGLTFRDAAFPDGGWRLQDLLGQPEHLKRVASEAGVDYLVLIGPARIEEYGPETGELPVLIPGAISAPVTSEIEAVIFDTATAKPLTGVTVAAEGTARMASYLIYMVGTDPMTRTAVIKGLSDSIIKKIAEQKSTEAVRIALLAAESATNPFRLDLVDESVTPARAVDPLDKLPVKFDRYRIEKYEDGDGTWWILPHDGSKSIYRANINTNEVTKIELDAEANQIVAGAGYVWVVPSEHFFAKFDKIYRIDPEAMIVDLRISLPEEYRSFDIVPGSKFVWLVGDLTENLFTNEADITQIEVKTGRIVAFYGHPKPLKVDNEELRTISPPDLLLINENKYLLLGVWEKIEKDMSYGIVRFDLNSRQYSRVFGAWCPSGEKVVLTPAGMRQFGSESRAVDCP